MDNLDLFDEDTHKRARRSDPETSKKAAKRYQGKLSERRYQVLHLVKIFPYRTNGELGRLMFNAYDLPIVVAASTPNKRLPELERLGYVERLGERECEDSGYMCAVWHITDKGVDALSGRCVD